MKSKRAPFIFSFFVILSLLILTKLFYLQIKQGEYYEALALGQQTSFQEIDRERGQIYFSSGAPLAQTESKIISYIYPEKAQEEVFSILELDNTESTVIKKEITQEQFDLLRDMDGVAIEKILARLYPQDNSACHVIGFTNQAGEGQYGIEGYFNKALKGEQGFSLKSRFSFFGKDESSQKKGKDIYLTLNQNIQYFSEKLLKEAKEKWDFDEAQIIVLEPKTGKILSLAINPDFNLNQFSKVNDLDVFLNSSIQKLYEPGSVFKSITMASGLEEDLIEPETEYVDEGSVEVGGPPIYNFEKRVWGKQSMIDVLEESINTGAVFVQQKLGKDKFLKYLDDFGFFERTGIELQGEVYSKNDALKRGYQRDLASASFGQSIQMTPLQLVKAFSALANGGVLMKPYIVERIEETSFSPKEEKRVISQTTSDKITAMMVSVVRNGSARRAQIPGYYVAGKTGTAQVPLKQGGYKENETIQSMIGYFPALDPKALIYVRLDNPKGVISAGYSAVPIFQELAKHIIDLWQIPPDYE